MTLILMLLYAATIPIANLMISSVGSCIPDGACVLPVGFGLSAPSGVLVIGAALVLRDAVHARGGATSAMVCILIGIFLSASLSPPSLVFASVAAFGLSEFADLAVYAPLARRRLWLAVALSGVVGAVIDSAVFLWLAFGSLDFIAGQVLGKVWVSLAAGVVLLALRRREAVK